jgi:hypothetical protein
VAGYEKLQPKNALRVGPRADIAFHNIPLAATSGTVSNNFGMTVYAPLLTLRGTLIAALTSAPQERGSMPF